MSAVYPTPTTKRCSRCRAVKTREEFHVLRRNDPSRLMPHCKTCYRADMDTRRDAINARRNARRATGLAHRYDTTLDKAERSGRLRARERGLQWERVSYAAIFERDSGVCYLCGITTTPETLSFDHVIPFYKGGSHTADNIRVAHRRCNELKGTADAGHRPRAIVQCPRCAHEFIPRKTTARERLP